MRRREFREKKGAVVVIQAAWRAARARRILGCLRALEEAKREILEGNLSLDQVRVVFAQCWKFCEFFNYKDSIAV